MKNDRLKSILGIPYFLFLVIFVVCPVLILLYYAFTNGAGEFSLANFTLFFTDSKAIGTLIYSVMVAVVTTIVCLLIAYPVSYLLAKGEFRRGNVLLMLFVMPMWINFTLRITALKEILTLIEGNLAFHPFLNTVIGMTYDFLPFMILPIYNTIAKINTGQTTKMTRNRKYGMPRMLFSLSFFILHPPKHSQSQPLYRYNRQRWLVRTYRWSYSCEGKRAKSTS